MNTLAFFFSDLESSTRLWERYPTAMHSALARHDAILRSSVAENGGLVVKSTGDGLMAVFEDPRAAVMACLQAQRQLADEPWEETGPLRVRIGVHVGGGTARDGDYYGPDVNRAARVMSAGHGGQVLLSSSVVRSAGHALPDESSVRDLGEHRLKDLAGPEHLYQLVAPGLGEKFPPLATLDLRPNNLPTQASAFLGREAQLVGLRQLLDSRDSRLISLTGPGGTGKTRLALQAAADQIDRFDDGVFLVDLAQQREAEGAFSAIVRTMGLEGAADAPALDVLCRDLEGKRLLLLLDNFEQVTAAAPGVTRLLEACPDLEVLVTSREALRVRGERVFPVPPLGVPAPSNGTAPSLEVVAASEAVQLLVERATSVRPDFRLTAANARAVASICQRLDGLPLAIELAAARLRMFSPDDLDRRLESRLDVLRGGARDLPDRQQTLRSTIEWSIDLLTAGEQRLFKVFSVFSGARFDAVEVVACGAANISEMDAVDQLESLVDKSLIRRIDRPDGEPRFSMLQTIHDLAAEQLAAEPDLGAAVTRLHAEHYLAVAKAARSTLAGPDRGRVLDDLTDDLDNSRKAWAYWVVARDLEKLNGLLDTLWPLHHAKGWYRGVVDLANDLLAVLALEPETPERIHEEIALQMSLARALQAIGGYTQEVQERFDRALQLTAESGNVPQRFPVLRSLASILMQRAEFGKAEDIGWELLAGAEQEGDPMLEMEARFVIGSAVALRNDFETGMKHLDRAIELFDPNRRQMGRFGIGMNAAVVSLTTSAFIQWWRGYPDDAAARGAKALRIAEQLEHPMSLAYATYHVGLLNTWRQDFGGVGERASDLMSISTEHDYPIWRSLAAALTGLARVATGDVEAGLEDVERGVAVYETLQTPPAFTAGVKFLRAIAFAMANQPQEALEGMEDVMAASGELVDPMFGAMGNTMLGDVFTMLDPPRMADAEAAYEKALAIASELGVRTVELQASTRLAGLHREGAVGLADMDSLREVYASFTEGFDEVDLINARAVLEQGTDSSS